MAQYDKETLNFMQKLAEDERKAEPAQSEDASSTQPQQRSPARVALSVARGLSNPKKRGAYVARTLTGIGVRTLLTKEAGTPISGVWDILNNEYGKDWWHWEPETVWQTLLKDHGFAPEDDLKSAINALQTVLTTNFVHEHWHVFEKVAHAFSTNDVDWNTLQPLEPDEVAAAVKILRELRPNTDFEDEVCAYMAASAKRAGLVYLPQQFFPKTAQTFLDKMGNDEALRDAVSSLWEAGARESSQSEEIEVQLGRLREIEERVIHA